MKITDDNYSISWIASPNCDSPGDLERTLIERRADIDVIGTIEDKDASYDYDDWALIRLDGKYYLLQTSGCSCPSPSETWRVVAGPTTLTAIRKKLESGDYSGYTVPTRQMDEFLAVIDKEAKARRAKRSKS